MSQSPRLEGREVGPEQSTIRLVAWPRWQALQGTQHGGWTGPNLSMFSWFFSFFHRFLMEKPRWWECPMIFDAPAHFEWIQHWTRGSKGAFHGGIGFYWLMGLILGVSIVMGVPHDYRWMVYGKIRPQKWMMTWGYPYDFGNLHFCKVIHLHPAPLLAMGHPAHRRGLPGSAPAGYPQVFPMKIQHDPTNAETKSLKKGIEQNNPH